MVRKVISWIVSGIAVILILFSIFLLLTVVTTKSGEVPKYLGYTAFRVLSGSMEPELPVDTLVLVKTCGTEEVKEGDIVSFYTEDPEIYGNVVTHRVNAVTAENGQKILETKGDANVLADKYPVTGENLIGRVVWSSVLCGKLVRLSSNPLIFGVFILLPLLIVMIMNVIQTVKTVKQMAKEELEADTKPAETGENSENRAPDEDDIENGQSPEISGGNSNNSGNKDEIPQESVTIIDIDDLSDLETPAGKGVSSKKGFRKKLQKKLGE